MLPEKSFGLLYKKDGYSWIVFARPSLNWLSDGKDRVETQAWLKRRLLRRVRSAGFFVSLKA